MPYDELEHCLEVGQEPFWGPLTWLMAACGIGGGLLIGLPLAGMLGLPSATGFLFGALFGLGLSVRYKGVAVARRLVLLLQAQRGGVVQLGEVQIPHRADFRVHRIVNGRPAVVIKRGRL